MTKRVLWTNKESELIKDLSHKGPTLALRDVRANGLLENRTDQAIMMRVSVLRRAMMVKNGSRRTSARACKQVIKTLLVKYGEWDYQRERPAYGAWTRMTDRHPLWPESSRYTLSLMWKTGVAASVWFDRLRKALG